jgi:hypothetical protein
VRQVGWGSSRQEGDGRDRRRESHTSAPCCTLAPGFAEVADFVEGRDDPRVEDFGAIGAIEAFDVGVLIGLTGLNEHQGDAVPLAPRPQGF